MLYRFITSGFTDAIAYGTALAAALWIFVVGQSPTIMPVFLTSVPPLYGVVVAVFFGALLICKHICLEGNIRTVRKLNAEKTWLEADVKSRDLDVENLTQQASTLNAEIGTLRSRIAVMEENSPDKQLSEMRVKLRGAEDDKKAALTVLVKNLQGRLRALLTVNDPQLLFAADVLRQELGLVENELKRGELSYYELCIKITDISDKLSELNDINMLSSFEQTEQPGKLADVWLHFIQANDDSESADIERTFKFFKVAFHPDRFTSESQKVEATRFFQQSINAYNSVKNMDRAAP